MTLEGIAVHLDNNIWDKFLHICHLLHCSFWLLDKKFVSWEKYTWKCFPTHLNKYCAEFSMYKLLWCSSMHKVPKRRLLNQKSFLKLECNLRCSTSVLVFGCWHMKHVIFLKLNKLSLLEINHVIHEPKAQN